MLATHKLNKLDWLRDQGAHDKPRRRKMAHAPAPKPCRANLCTRAYMAHKTSPEHRKMTQYCQRSKLAKSAQRTSSSTPSCCWRATLSGIMATPRFLGYRPPRHPVG